MACRRVWVDIVNPVVAHLLFKDNYFGIAVFIWFQKIVHALKFTQLISFNTAQTEAQNQMWLDLALYHLLNYFSVNEIKCLI